MTLFVYAESDHGLNYTCTSYWELIGVQCIPIFRWYQKTGHTFTPFITVYEHAIILLQY